MCQFPLSKMYEPVELPSSKLAVLPVAGRRYQRGSGLTALTSRVEILGSTIVPWFVMSDFFLISLYASEYLISALQNSNAIYFL